MLAVMLALPERKRAVVGGLKNILGKNRVLQGGCRVVQGKMNLWEGGLRNFLFRLLRILNGIDLS